MFNKFGKILTTGAGITDSVKKQIELIAKEKIESYLRSLDFVSRDEFEILKRRVEELEKERDGKK